MCASLWPSMEAGPSATNRRRANGLQGRLKVNMRTSNRTVIQLSCAFLHTATVVSFRTVRDCVRPAKMPFGGRGGGDRSSRPSLIIRNLPLDTRYVAVPVLFVSAERIPTRAPVENVSMDLCSQHCVCRKAEVQDLFNQFGDVRDVYLPLNHYTRCDRSHTTAASRGDAGSQAYAVDLAKRKFSCGLEPDRSLVTAPHKRTAMWMATTKSSESRGPCCPSFGLESRNELTKFTSGMKEQE